MNVCTAVVAATVTVKELVIVMDGELGEPLTVQIAKVSELPAVGATLYCTETKERVPAAIGDSLTIMYCATLPFSVPPIEPAVTGAGDMMFVPTKLEPVTESLKAVVWSLKFR
ncbi:MAG: hypothetical protein ABR889_01700 [Acidobacteriaceae bacterium]